MLTDLSFLNIGSMFPPRCEKARLDMYEQNKKLFLSDHVTVYETSLKRIERIIGNFGDVISFVVIANFQKLMSLKIADLLLGEPPNIKCEDSPQQKTIETIEETSDLINTSYMAAIDVSRFGTGLLYVRRNTKQQAIIDITQPCFWYPVVSPDNVHDFIAHVLAWYTYDSSGAVTGLTAQIHEIGRVTTRKFAMENYTIQKLSEPEVIMMTGLDDFAVIPIQNILTSDSCTGLDDYTDVDSIISEIMVRIGQVARILDKHASPSMQGPYSALEMDEETGEWRCKVGNFFARNTTEDPPTEYIVWDGQLTANFTQIEKLTNLLYTVSEMGSALFGDMSANAGQVPSGSALRRLLISPLAKVNRIRMRFDPALKHAIKLCSQLGGTDITNLSRENISITWQDGLPGDPSEEATIMATRTGAKPTMSQFRALTTYDAMSDEDADEELARIQDEEAASTPVQQPPQFMLGGTGAIGGSPAIPVEPNTQPITGEAPIVKKENPFAK